MFLVSLSFAGTFADVISLKNGRNIEGLVVAEDKNSVQLDVGSGIVTFKMTDILEVHKTGFEESSLIRKKWLNNKLKAEAAIAERESQPRKIEIEQNKGHITIDALLNGKVKANLLLDTGATYVVISAKVAQKLGINLKKEKKELLLQVADGRKVKAKLITLKSIKIEEVQADNVEAAVIFSQTGMGDGVIGMSFLKLYNFKVDYAKNKLILEKIK